MLANGGWLLNALVPNLFDHGALLQPLKCSDGMVHCTVTWRDDIHGEQDIGDDHSMADRAAGHGRRGKPTQDSQDADSSSPAQDHHGYILDAAIPLEPVQHILRIRLWSLICSIFLAMLQHAGLEMLQYILNVRLDILMLTALIKRWSPMTNTFHMTVGEMRVTLQDVAIILGCRVDGPALIGPAMVGADSRWESWPDCCMELLGATPIPNQEYVNPFRPAQTSTVRMG